MMRIYLLRKSITASVYYMIIRLLFTFSFFFDSEQNWRALVAKIKYTYNFILKIIYLNNKLVSLRLGWQEKTIDHEKHFEEKYSFIKIFNCKENIKKIKKH
ncbi:hypothetical protein BpHYR1_028260 [Brachionus plicatilis]|uniref:Uncharacterized protein n=1 Tax=Brachionus plicatilis TaxID=10195 RepID=A0A3M7P533_BRAPC|nr:hypothetical protein BpHYR1_028260 [Brachionus plicatilis]